MSRGQSRCRQSCRSFQGLVLGLALLTALLPVGLLAQSSNDGGPASRANDSGAAETKVERPLGVPAGPPRSGAQLDALTEELANEMRCPVCQGLSIAASRSISALNMRNEVRELLAAGYSEDQVLDYFEQSYGEFVRLTPKPTGVNLLVWILPIAALLTGAVLIGRHRARQRRQDDETESEEVLDDYRRRVLKETAGE